VKRLKTARFEPLEKQAPQIPPGKKLFHTASIDILTRTDYIGG
jgi:hypothetical protein